MKNKQATLVDARTKIVATVGPSCQTAEQLAELATAGVDVFRVNTAHGDRESHSQTVASIRQASKLAGRPVATLVDLAGPKIRLGSLATEPTYCHQGATFRFIRGETSQLESDLVSNYPRLVDELAVDDVVMLADGTVSMIVTEKSDEAATCEVTAAGAIRSRQGINLPGAKLTVPAMTERDIENTQWAATADVDYVSLSFVRHASDIFALRDLLNSHGSSSHVIAKIEKPEALDALDDIVAVSDAVMVARGDLGVEIDIAETPVAQKRIINTCHRYHKPVIVATQMLDSMTQASQPTRAEATDVANALLDGADACMLSGETAIGKHPLLVVETMHRIMRATEELLRNESPRFPEVDATNVHPVTSAVVSGAGQIARRVDAKLVVVATRSGATALAKSKLRDFVPTLAVSNSEATLRRLCLYWGITPLAGAPVREPGELREFVGDWGKETGRIKQGDRVVFVTGTDVMPNTHNLVFVHEYE